MNKTVTANISGIVFHIEADAYEKLNKYLNTIRNFFKASDGKDEIMADIEARIAELFKEHLDAGKEVITDANVNKVIEIMGEPEQYMDEDAAEDFSTNSSSDYSSNRNFKTKKLFRDNDDNVIGGVCSGLSYYFGIDRIWFRAAFLIALFGFGTGFLLYLILWIIIPAPKTTADKLDMKGEPINVENIGNTIKDEFSSFKKKVNNGQASQYGQRAENAIFRFFDFLGKILFYLFKFIAKIIGVAFVVVSSLAIVSLLTVLFGGPFIVDINNLTVDNDWFSNYSDMFFTSSTLFYLGLTGLFLVLFMPLLGILYGGLKILFKIPSSTKAVSIIGTSSFVIGIILISITAITTTADFSKNQRIYESMPLKGMSSDTINLSTLKNTYSYSQIGDLELMIEDGEIYMNTLRINVKKAKDSVVNLSVKKSAQGPNRKEAGIRAENILYEYAVEGNNLRFSPFISVPYPDKYRCQEVDISIDLPIGKTIFLDNSSRELIYDIKNVTNTYDGRMMGHHWKMTKRGLKCTDCSWSEEKEEKDVIEEIS